MRKMAVYAGSRRQEGVRLQHISRHLLGLFRGIPGARRWRRFLAEQSRRGDAAPELLLQSLSLVSDA